MNSVKNTYLIVTLILRLVLLALAVFSPIYITPGWYFWTAFFLVSFIVTGYTVTERIDKWITQ